MMMACVRSHVFASRRRSTHTYTVEPHVNVFGWDRGTMLCDLFTSHPVNLATIAYVVLAVWTRNCKDGGSTLCWHRFTGVLGIMIESRGQKLRRVVPFYECKSPNEYAAPARYFSSESTQSHIVPITHTFLMNLVVKNTLWILIDSRKNEWTRPGPIHWATHASPYIYNKL